MTSPVIPSYFSAVSNPVYVREDQSMIDCSVTFSETASPAVAGTTHRYTAAAHDPMDYGQQLWDYLNADGAGEIGAYVAPTLNPVQCAIAALAAGINLSSTETPDLNAVYPVDQTAQNKVNGLTTFILLNNAFPGGLTAMPWYDMAGSVHYFPSVSAFKNFASGFASFVAAVMLYADSNGEIGEIPSNEITIP